MSQNDIIRELENEPYELNLERKAVGRIISLLFNEGLHVYSDKTGAWYDKAVFCAWEGNDFLEDDYVA